MSRPRRRQLAVAAFIILLLAFLLTTFRVTVVHGDSMLPTYKNGQMVIVNRLGRTWSRGDVVLVQAGNEILIKRIRYLPGELVPADHAWMFDDVGHFFESGDRPDAPLKVPAGHVVVLGDNLRASDDSRSFGPISIRQIFGRVINAPPLR